MKDAPEIAPEIRALLEEIVADPRSAIRLVPRRALRAWFDTGETVRASDVVRTSAERHLVEMHREELAALLCEASWISYWKAPVLASRPTGADGKLYNPTEREPDWRRRAERAAAVPSLPPDGIELLRQCLSGIQPQRGWDLGLASLSLVPRDLTRFYIALSVPWSKPRVAVALLARFARRARPLMTRRVALLSLAARTCALDLFEQAREVYREAASLEPQSPCARMCAFNLSCFLGEERNALAEAEELIHVSRQDDPRVVETQSTLREWTRTQSDSELDVARSTARKLYGRIPEAAAVVCRGYDS
jgi:hypothetical protein